MTPKRPTAMRAVASCLGCSWALVSKNAQAMAAKHYDRTGHKTLVKIEIDYGADIPKDLPGQTTMFGGENG